MSHITKPSKAMRAAAKLVNGNQVQFLCHALNTLWWDGKISWTTRLTCQEYICRLLQGHTSLDEWIQARHALPKHHQRKMRQTRAQWAEWIAQQYEAIGQ